MKVDATTHQPMAGPEYVLRAMLACDPPTFAALAKRMGVSKRALMYLSAGWRTIKGRKHVVRLSYAEQFLLENIIEEGSHDP